MYRFLKTAAPLLVVLGQSLSAADSAPVDAARLIAALKAMREQQEQQVKANRQKALQEVAKAAASGPAAAAAWEEAVRITQFEGASREGAMFKEWKDKDGAGLDYAEAQNAARLFFQWMHLTLQRAGGVPVKDLLPYVVAYTKELAQDQAAMEAFKDRIAHTKDVAASGHAQTAREKVRNEEVAKRMHDSIMSRGVAASPPAQAMRIGDLLNAEGWESNPGNMDGIFNSIILPELRRTGDARLLEYWDNRIRKETDAMADQKLSFEQKKFVQERRPELLWARAQDDLLLGNKNRAIGAMFDIIKNYPSHRSAGEWIKRLEDLLTPAPTSPSVSISPAPAGGNAVQK